MQKLDLNHVFTNMAYAAFYAGRAMQGRQPNTKRLSTRKDFLTDADGQAEEMILAHLRDAYADIPAHSEEAGGNAILEGLGWVVDPIDGTLNFFMQDLLWGVSIALVEDARTIAAAVFLPGYNQLFGAYQGQKSFRIDVMGPSFGTRHQIFVNDAETVSDAQYWFDWNKGNHDRMYKLIKRIDETSLYPQTRGCSVAGALSVATGRMGGYFFPQPEPFDIAATGLIIENAGGKVTDFEGNQWSPYSKSFLASNGKLHDELLKLTADL